MSAVTQWKDKSGLGYHFTQATGANQPASGIRSVNGLNVVDFDGSSDFMQSTPYIDVPWTYIAVILPDVVTGQTVVLGCQDGVGLYPLVLDTGHIGAGRGAGLQSGYPSISAGTPHVVTQYCPGTAGSDPTGGPCRVDGGAFSDSTHPLWGAHPRQPQIGATFGGGNYFNGVIAELLAYPTVLPIQQIISIEQYLMRKWGIPLPAFTPLAIKNLVGWWDAADTASIAATGGLVNQWNDKSGLGNHWLKYGGGGAGYQPVTGTRTQNGLNTLDFTGQDTTNLTIAGGGPPAGFWGGPTNRYVWCVYQADVITQQGETVLVPSGASGYDWRLGATDTGATGKQSIGLSGVSNNIPAGQTARAAGVTYICAMRTEFDGNVSTLITAYLNGVQNGTTLTAAFVFNNHNFGWFLGNNLSAGFGLNGILCELVIVDDIISASDRAALDAYGNAKWAVY